MRESSGLAHVFLIHASLDPDKPEAAALVAGDAFERRIEALWQRGREAWPKLRLTVEDFARHLGERLPEGEAPDRYLASVIAEDLYLAAACLRRVPAAIEAFERDLLSQARPALIAIDPSAAFADEVCQALLEKLFVAPAGVPPKIADYSGRGPLVQWIRVAARRTALNMKRGAIAAPLDEAAPPDPPLAMLSRHGDVELDYLRARYRDELRTALIDALRALPVERRNVLRLYFVGGLSLEKIGALFRVHQTTVTRWVAAAREAVLGETWRLLRERLQLSPTELESLVTVLRSDIDLSLSAALPQEI